MQPKDHAVPAAMRSRACRSRSGVGVVVLGSDRVQRTEQVGELVQVEVR
jgi:hypothetical protein